VGVRFDLESDGLFTFRDDVLNDVQVIDAVIVKLIALLETINERF
jgi:hypothetical protein